MAIDTVQEIACKDATLVCRVCGREKTRERFVKNGRRRGEQLRARICKLCLRVSVRRSILKCVYGLTPEQFQQMVTKANRRCAICGKVAALCIDHDHKTEAVRGLLCQHCNKGLGFFQDSPERLRAAIVYLGRGGLYTRKHRKRTRVGSVTHGLFNHLVQAPLVPNKEFVYTS